MQTNIIIINLQIFKRVKVIGCEVVKEIRPEMILFIKTKDRGVLGSKLR